jgi:hypothetical protein
MQRTTCITVCAGRESSAKPTLQKQLTRAVGRVVPTGGRPDAEASAAFTSAGSPPAQGTEEKMGLRQLLSEYGVIALFFHFTVWVTCLGSVYALLAFGLPLPEWVVGPADGTVAAAGAAGRVAATLGIVEVVGPARIALTIAVTPRISARAREFAFVRNLEALCAKAWDALVARRGGQQE